MSIVQSKYKEICPQATYLVDTVVLAQAWKKSHQFIRRHNWYADVLELDSSVVGLEQQLAQWSQELNSFKFKTGALRLVPAPKNAKWTFRDLNAKKTFEQHKSISLDDLLEDLSDGPSFNDWQPSSDNSADPDNHSKINQKLRPLAHLSIRDQTVATAAMMCLADAVETAQGDPTTDDYIDKKKESAVNYGNRLHCNWIKSKNQKPRAQFSWGNNRTYRQYFEDYRSFLARPRRVCTDSLPHLKQNRELYVVSLDIKSFYDYIYNSALIKELMALEQEHRQRFGSTKKTLSDNTFWALLSDILSWNWHADAHKYAKEITGDAAQLELGLPQGLVAAGFFANAYLVKFDNKMRARASLQEIINEDIKILDYCRYVDDIRIVVEAPAGSLQYNVDYVRCKLIDAVNSQLKEHCRDIGAAKDLTLSENKCTATPFRSISTRGNLSGLMDVLNTELSGTFDLESLIQAAGGFDGLLIMSEQLDAAQIRPPSRLRLSTIALPNNDVRDDTVKRFVATRLAQLMRERLAMTDSNSSRDGTENSDSTFTSSAAIAHEFELTARKLIRSWSENPSLVLLLRCGLDLFPHPKLLDPVIEALEVKLFNSIAEPNVDQQREILVAQYVAAELLRAGAVETGYRSNDQYPNGIDIEGFRHDLSAFARHIVLAYQQPPWYLLQQAYLYLSSQGELAPPKPIPNSPELTRHMILQQVMLYTTLTDTALVSALPLAMIAQQIKPNIRRFGLWFNECLRNTADEALQESAIKLLALNRPDLLMSALDTQRSKHKWRRYVPQALLEAKRRANRPWKGTGANRSYSLLHIIRSPENPFCQENALLMLANSLLRVENIKDKLNLGLSPESIIIKCDDWSNLQSLPTKDDFLTIVLEDSTSNPLYSLPDWVEKDKAWLYGLGQILRSALTGEFDYTSRHYLVTENIGQYTGLRSTWYSRRLGLLNTSRGLLNEPGPVSPWLSSLLTSLLQWPGAAVSSKYETSISSCEAPEELLPTIEGRINEQRQIFCHRTNTPVYVVPTRCDGALFDRPLRVGVVQPLRPRVHEFDTKDPTHWTPSVLAEHRAHLATICRLVHQKLRAWNSSKSKHQDKAEDGTPLVDLVLFPELAVHPEHIDLLRRLSDNLRCNIFAGLTFLHSEKLKSPINQGLWLIRTESETNGRSIEYAWQGKKNPMKLERDMGIVGYRPHITLVELPIGTKNGTRVAAAICYDATDLDLVSDLREKSDVFLVAALNQDVLTFDNMVAALHFHMYQPVILANGGEFGGSTAQAPYPKHERLIAHVHGNNQVAVSVFEIDPSHFKSVKPQKPPKEVKTAPAGYKGR